MEEVQGVKGCVSWEAGFIFEATRRFISVLLDQFCGTAVRHGNLLLQMMQSCVGQGVRRSG